MIQTGVMSDLFSVIVIGLIVTFVTFTQFNKLLKLRVAGDSRILRVTCTTNKRNNEWHARVISAANSFHPIQA